MNPTNLLLVLSFYLATVSVAVSAQEPQPDLLSKRLGSEPVSQLVNDARKFGDPRRGAIAFYQPTMNCARCHEPQGGRRLGPDLAEKRQVEIAHLVESLLHPSAKIKEGFETAKILLEDGRQVSGILVKETESHLVVDQIEQPDKPLEIPKNEIDDWTKTKTSSMPEGLANQMSGRQPFLDLISYLDQIAREGAGRAAELKPTGLAVLAPLPKYESRIDHTGLIASLNDEALERGAETYRLRCASCHGTLEEEGSMPTSLRFASGKFKNGNDPFRMYQTLTHGFGMMNPQRWMVPQQKYEVIHYIREHFLKTKNTPEHFKVTDGFLAKLPKGDTRGPKPVVSRPWTAMDYGPSLNNTIEVSKNGSNIAQKGIAVRLDAGPGGVESGSHWLMYEHDTMRVAGAWTGHFINWEGIHFNGTHGRHPSVAGKIHFGNPTGPGFGKPQTQALAEAGDVTKGLFEDDRVVGRDGKHYGPLPSDWARYLGMYRFGKQTIIKYRVGETEILESPGLTFAGDHPVYTRTMNLGHREKDLVIQVAKIDGQAHAVEASPENVAIILKSPTGEKIATPPKATTRKGSEIPEAGGNETLTASVSASPGSVKRELGLLAGTSLDDAKWIVSEGNLRLLIRAGEPVNVVVSHCPIATLDDAREVQTQLVAIQKPRDLSPLIQGGPANYPEKLTTKIKRGNDEGPFAVDVFERPKKNPWNCQLRLTGLDFLPDGETAIISAWDGSVWRVTGFGPAAEKTGSDTLTWQRIAAGLFQPLGVKYSGGKIYVTCRDQLVILHDLNGDYEADWYENFNSDHQVTEHFHEFAMGLQTDDAGNFYYAKSARHAKTALVPHHGTLLKVSPDGKQTEILANGFRAANGVCINPDGSFLVTDQEGHWNPKNRINWVRPGEFYGNMFGYHDVTDESDSAMSDPLCWITNAFDRSPSELLWVDSDKWGPLNGSLLNFSYGYGKIYVVPHEEVDGQMQGGMCEFPIPKFPTGVMRGRFHPGDGQLYCCGMFAWAGSQQQPGGLYRVRYTGKPVHLPIGLGAKTDGIEIKFSGPVDRDAANDPSNYSVNSWDLKRTANYGSKHFNEQRLEVSSAKVAEDGLTVKLTVPEIKLTWGMEINYSIKTDSGERLQGKIHNSIYRLRK